MADAVNHSVDIKAWRHAEIVVALLILDRHTSQQFDRLQRPNGGLILVPTALTVINRQLIVDLAARHRLPAIYPYRYFVTAGGLMCYGADEIDQYRLAAGYVDRILKGEKPADLPVQQPTKYETVLNMKTAKALGLDVPTEILLRADEVIE